MSKQGSCFLDELHVLLMAAEIARRSVVGERFRRGVGGSASCELPRPGHAAALSPPPDEDSPRALLTKKPSDDQHEGSWSAGTLAPTRRRQRARWATTSSSKAAVEGSDFWEKTLYGFQHDSGHALLAPWDDDAAIEVSFDLRVHGAVRSGGSPCFGTALATGSRRGWSSTMAFRTSEPW